MDTDNETKADALDDGDLARRLAIERGSAREITAALGEQLLATVSGLSEQDLFRLEQILAENGVTLQEALTAMLRAAGSQGVTTAAGQLETIGLATDFSLVNSAVVDFAADQGIALFGTINGSSEQIFAKAIEKWLEAGNTLPELSRIIADHIQEGAPLPDLISNLATTFGRSRAEAIASTEVTRAFAEGNRQAWEQVSQETGIVIQRQWRTANDERVCPICAPLGGLVFGAEVARPSDIERQRRRGQEATLQGSFTHPGGRGAAADFENQQYQGPPAHPRCRCWVVPVVSGVDEGVLID